MNKKEERIMHEYENVSTEALMRIVTVDKENYQSLTIDIIKRILRERNINEEDIAKFQEESLEKINLGSFGEKKIEPTPKQAKLPLMWIGYFIVAICIILDLTPPIKEMGLKYSPGSIMGVIYWLICVYQIHEVLIEEDNSYPIKPAKGALYNLIPIFNLYWIFKWPFHLGKFVNERRLSSKRSTILEMSGIFLLIAIAAGRALGAAIGLAIIFTTGVYFNREVRSVIGLKKIEQVKESTYFA